MTKKKDLSLEGLRGLASLAVVLAHILFVYFPYLTSLRAPYPKATPKTLVDLVLINPPFRLLYAADAAVLIFMVLSGYVLMAKFYRTDTSEVLETAATKRYIRLVLPAFASVLFAWAILSSGLMANQLAGTLNTAGWPIHYYTQPVSLVDAIINGLFMAPLFGDSSINGPLWTLQTELLGSILLFASYALFGRRSLLLVCAWFLFFANVLGGKQPHTLYYIGLLAGSLLHVVTPWLKARPLVSTLFVVVGLLSVMADHSSLYAPLMSLPLPNLQSIGPDYNANKVLFWQAVGSISLVAGTIGSSWFATLLASRVPAYLGRISFALYLLHMPLIMSLAFWGMLAGKTMGFGYLASAAFSFTLFMVVLVTLAELFTRFVDAPSIKLADWVAAKLSRRNAINFAPQLTPAPELGPVSA